ncbi:hypothetical protein C4D60_Mb04t09580 [Musa balbisiana]|uniref:Uncharacterized protein n=1 Tax=Musa balbisiana TaxID=52838 RepID=A0A4S8KAW9_MUSBA|nr:hypothetical protein C4D60_Mb04t09580 [Musa balbisiana]
MAGGGEAFGAEKEETPNETAVELQDNSEAKKLDKQKFSHFCSFFLIRLFYVIGEAHHVADAGGIDRIRVRVRIRIREEGDRVMPRTYGNPTRTSEGHRNGINEASFGGNGSGSRGIKRSRANKSSLRDQERTD